MPNTQSLPQTKDYSDAVVVLGTITGTKRDNFYTEGVSKNGKTWKKINFGVDTGNGATVWFELFGSERDNVYAHRPAEKGEKKGDTKKIPWNNRKNIPDGYRLIGLGIGMEKGEDGKDVYENMTELDTIDFLTHAETFVDGTYVRVKAKFAFNSYTNKKGDHVTQTKFIPNSIALSSEPDEPVAPSWSQNFIINSIDRDSVKKNPEGNPAYYVELTNIGYNSLNHTSVYVYSDRLAKSIKNELKKGMFSCDCWGIISITPAEVDEVETTDEWGDENPTAHVSNNSFTRDLIMTGCRGAEADHDTYTESTISAFEKELKARADANTAFEGKDAGTAKPSAGTITSKPKADAFDDWGDAKTDDLPF